MIIPIEVIGLVTMVTLDELDNDEPALTTTTGVPEAEVVWEIFGNIFPDPPALIIFIPKEVY